jgi:abortive infection bacteriophage resistance protein
LVISDVPAAKACLERIGYYRLSGYWYPFRKSHLDIDPQTGRPRVDRITRKEVIVVEDDFLPGTTFSQVMDLYVFDKRLRLIFFDAIERIEIALRVDIALLLGARSQLAHRDPLLFDTRFGVTRNTTGETQHGKWLAKLDKAYLLSSEEFVKHFRFRYPSDFPPIWVAIEMCDFGAIAKMLEGMKYNDRVALARRYSLPRPELLVAFIKNINSIRNLCAHHSRLWNRSPEFRIALPMRGEIPLLTHLIDDVNANSRLYATAAALQFILRRVNPSTAWAQRLKKAMTTLPTVNGITAAKAGFPAGWENLALWVNSITTPPSQEAIATKAFYLWENLGNPESQSDAIWFAAEKDLKDQA